MDVVVLWKTQRVLHHITCSLLLKVNPMTLVCHRITLEDDDEDEDLDVEPAPRRPVLVISDSLKEGLQCGISDILPHTVAQSVYVLLVLLLECLMLKHNKSFTPFKTQDTFFPLYNFVSPPLPRSHSCMELVLWRPPEDPFCRKRKGSLHKQRKPQTASQHPLTPCSSPTPHSPSSPPADTHSPLYSFPVAHSSGEEDMEMWERSICLKSHIEVTNWTKNHWGLWATVIWSLLALHEYCALLWDVFQSIVCFTVNFLWLLIGCNHNAGLMKLFYLFKSPN